MAVRKLVGRIFYTLLALAVFAYGLLAAQLFVIGENPVEFHVDPLTVKEVQQRYQYLVAPKAAAATAPNVEGEIFDATPRDVMIAFDEVAMSAPRTKLAAGSPTDMWATYVQRSKYMRFPDYISVTAIGTPDGRATVAVFSQSIYGANDLGVNKARIDLWLGQLSEALNEGS